MMRWSCKIPKFRRHFCSAIRSLWVTPPCQWPEMLHQATTVSLWKRKGSPGDLNNHRGICLISLWGRVLGRIVAARLARYAEQQGILDTAQWGGFREARSTHGALAVVRRVLDAATKPFGSQVLDPCCVEPLDLKLKKAYPNSSRNAFYTVMRHFGASEGILRVIQGLIQLTQYRCREGKILSEPFTMQRGFKEGCPASSVEFNFLQEGILRTWRQKMAEHHLRNSTGNRQRCGPLSGPTVAGAACGRDFSVARDRAGPPALRRRHEHTAQGVCGSTPQNVIVETHGTVGRHSSSGQVAAPALQAFTYSGGAGQGENSGDGFAES